jgi:hypothetical protein
MISPKNVFDEDQTSVNINEYYVKNAYLQVPSPKRFDGKALKPF